MRTFYSVENNGTNWFVTLAEAKDYCKANGGTPVVHNFRNEAKIAGIESIMGETTMNEVRGYKVFNPDWTCRNFQYEVGKTYTMKAKPVICRTGFHFCRKASDCFNYYYFKPENKVAEVVAFGDIDEQNGGTKVCTNKIKIVREIDWYEVLDLVNIGVGNTGLSNSGDYNSGNYNSGYRNSGNYNSGDYNSGYRNSGYRNSGDYNSGDYNSGNYNSGNRNSGDYNRTNYSSGCFNTEESTIKLFNKESSWVGEDWRNSKAGRLLLDIDMNILDWISYSNMTDEEKASHPEAETTGGYLKKLDISECAQIWWDGLDEDDRCIIKAIPNFDAKIFKECTGIDVNK